jgi:hypothetical protein
LQNERAIGGFIRLNDRLHIERERSGEAGMGIGLNDLASSAGSYKEAGD